MTPVAYLRAANALRALERRAELAAVQAEHLARRQARKAAAALPAARPAEHAALPEVRERHVPALPEQAGERPVPRAAGVAEPAEVREQERPGAEEPRATAGKSAATTSGATARPAVTASPVRPMLAGPAEQAAAAAGLPAERQRPRPRPQTPGPRIPSFSFFDRGAALRAAAPAPSVGSVNELAQRQDQPELSAPQLTERQAPAAEPDLADVLGEEVGATQVVDLTPEDDTELLDLGELRAERG